MQTTPEEDAKKIIAEFTRALEESKKDSPSHESSDLFIVHSDKSMRTPKENPEGQKEKGNKKEEQDITQKEFTAIFFSNAPRIHNNCILMEKKQW